MSIERIDDIYIDDDGIPNKPLKFTQNKYQYLFNKKFFESQKTNYNSKHVCWIDSVEHIYKDAKLSELPE